MATSHGEGYAQIAWRMSRHPDLAIVRRFRAMNLQNILYLQAELNELEDTLKQQEEIDRSSSNEQQRWNARSWSVLSKGTQIAGGDDQKWSLCLRIREKLREYSETSCLWK
jgi:hypothetical protein